MKPRIRFYNDGTRVKPKGNNIVRWDLLPYILQLKKLEENKPL